MHPSAHALTEPTKAAVIMADTGETITYEELNARANQAAHLFRAEGAVAGDCIAILMTNAPAYFELAWGAQRSGLYYVCISTKFTAEEAAYVLGDSGAKVLMISGELGPLADELATLRPGLKIISVGPAVPGLRGYEGLRDAMPRTPIADESAGADLLYSSGTTGRPKGVKAPLPGGPPDAPNPLVALAAGFFGLAADSVYLSPAPLYHAAPLRWCMSVHRLGGTTVVMPKFEPEAYLQAVERYRATDTQVVPTMFVRMLKLPPETRARYDCSSLRTVIHAAAPCPIPIKEQMIEWWGPIIKEYYAGTEGNGFCALTSEEWLKKKGSVGRALLGVVHVCGEAGEELPVGQDGVIYFEGSTAFEYHNDPKKTAESRHPAHPDWSTLGDIGHVDADGYVYLTDRKAYMIISGGVNIYPQEVENLLVTHPKVADAAVFGVPNEEFGEEVKAVVQPLDWAEAGPALEAELMGFCRAHLSHVKCPRSIDFLEELPRHPTGKLYKRLLRDRYWGDRASRIV
ncbi:MAG: acyl-CoA synthetase [Hydrogenophilaceae bacterium]|nr:acyl-CoA synthetase [Hydrogenophilaceae bacterium]